MDRKLRAPGESGAGAPAGGNGGGGAASPPAQPPTGGGGAPAPVVPPTAPPVASIPLDALPEQLRGLPESQIKFTLNRMVEGLAATNRRNQELEAQIKGSRPAPGAAIPIKEPTAPTTPKKPLDVRLLEEPEAALDEFLATRFGGALSKLNEVTERVGRAELVSLRSEIDDFKEHEAEVLEVLETNGLDKTRENLVGAYTMIVGKKTLEERSRSRRAASNPENAAPVESTPNASYTKNELTEEIRKSLGMSEDDYYVKYSDPTKLEIKVPR